MILDYNPSSGAYFLRVNRSNHSPTAIMEEHGLDFSATASTPAEAVRLDDVKLLRPVVEETEEALLTGALEPTNEWYAVAKIAGIKLAQAFRKQFGDDAITEGGATMGAEDFALLAERVPAFQLRIGSSQPGRHDHLHNSDYQPDERCIGLGAQAVARAAMELLAR